MNKNKLVSKTVTSPAQRESEIRVSVQNAQVMTDLSQLSAAERSNSLMRADILYEYGGAAGFLLRPNFERDFGISDRKRMADGAIKSLLESSSLNENTDVVMNQVDKKLL